MREVVRRTLLHGQVTRENLEQMTGQELEAGCLLLGIPKNGTVDEKRDRILSTWELRQYIKDWGDDVEERQAIAAAHTGKQLKAMCKAHGIYCGGNKYAMVSGLIGWRNRCRMMGQQALKEAMAAVRERQRVHGAQLDMFRSRPRQDEDFEV